MNETKNLCEKCGKPKIAYYREYCPRCEKPKVKCIEQYNLFECMYYIEATGHENFKEKLWEVFCEHYSVLNDITIEVCNVDSHPLIQELFEKMGIEDDFVLFEISW